VFQYSLRQYSINYTDRSRAVVAYIQGRAITCDWDCLSVCPFSKRKTARAISTKFGQNTVHGSRRARIDPEVKRSKVKVTRLSNELPTWDLYVDDCVGFLVIVFVFAERHKPRTQTITATDTTRRKEFCTIYSTAEYQLCRTAPEAVWACAPARPRHAGWWQR